MIGEVSVGIEELASCRIRTEFFEHIGYEESACTVTCINNDVKAFKGLISLSAAVNASSSLEDLDAVLDEIRAEISGDPGFKKGSASTKNRNVNKGDPNKMVGVAKSGKASSRALREAAKRANAGKGNKDKSKERALPCRRYVTSDGYEILAGRNNIQNDQLTFHTASRRDWWFHVKGLPGTHVRPDLTRTCLQIMRYLKPQALQHSFRKL